jgi:hypothetical protein
MWPLGRLAPDRKMIVGLIRGRFDYQKPETLRASRVFVSESIWPRHHDRLRGAGCQKPAFCAKGTGDPLSSDEILSASCFMSVAR